MPDKDFEAQHGSFASDPGCYFPRLLGTACTRYGCLSSPGRDTMLASVSCRGGITSDGPTSTIIGLMMTTLMSARSRSLSSVMQYLHKARQ